MEASSGGTLLILVVGMSGTYLAGFLCYRNVMYVPPVLLTPVPKVLAIINLVLLPLMIGHFLANLPAVIQVAMVSFMAGTQ